jgi:2,4-dienoyl-CoA reductase-like NADH-dependent reductase (Old Yellow Enzyme family)
MPNAPTPGVYTPAHIAGWKKVTAAVHDKGGRIFIQTMHAGRMSHPDNTPHHRQAVAPCAIAPGTQMFTATGMQDIPTPRALTSEEVRRTVVDFRLAARSAIEAGADGVEIHGANAYLVQQFLAPSANTRTDAYGGSIANRARFAIEVVTAIAEEIGADRTAIRLSPGLTMWGIDEGAEGTGPLPLSGGRTRQAWSCLPARRTYRQRAAAGRYPRAVEAIADREPARSSARADRR